MEVAAEAPQERYRFVGRKIKNKGKTGEGRGVLERKPAASEVSLATEEGA